MVPCDTQFGVRAEDGSFAGTIEYYKDGGGPMQAEVYAVFQGRTLSHLPLADQENLGEKVQFLIDSGDLFKIYEATTSSTKTWRVDDYMTGVSWVISFDGTPDFYEHGVVYAYHPNGEVENDNVQDLPSNMTEGDFWDFVASRSHAVMYDYMDQAHPLTLKDQDVLVASELGALNRTFVDGIVWPTE